MGERRGRKTGEKVTMKPGKPLVCGMIGSKPNGIFSSDT